MGLCVFASGIPKLLLIVHVVTLSEKSLSLRSDRLFASEDRWEVANVTYQNGGHAYAFKKFRKTVCKMPPLR